MRFRRLFGRTLEGTGMPSAPSTQPRKQWGWRDDKAILAKVDYSVNLALQAQVDRSADLTAFGQKEQRLLSTFHLFCCQFVPDPIQLTDKTPLTSHISFCWSMLWFTICSGNEVGAAINRTVFKTLYIILTFNAVQCEQATGTNVLCLFIVYS